MSDDEEPWIRWVCEAISRGCHIDDIIDELSLQGHPDAKRFVTEISRHPILSWGMQQRSRLKSLALYKKLHSSLDQRAGNSLIELQFPDDYERVDHFYRTNQPYVLKGWANHWLAFEKPWSAERFIQEFSESEIEITDGRDSRQDQGQHL